MTGIAALALCAGFTSCSKDLTPASQQEINQAKYEAAFVKRFGEPASNQTWGFGVDVAGTRSGNTSGDYTAYPATHEYKDASGNVIAGANMNHNEWADPDKYYGGWLVPDALTEGQKLRVQKYFQANPNLSYEDPHYANFFIQQVYTGGTSAPETGNKEATKAANGDVHAGSTLNQLTVGQACSHINDFNAGTCSPSNVLDNGSNVNNGTYHSDQITLMVNVDDTSCFGYHETGGSNVKGVINHNDKMALVSAAVIDAWAAENGNPGEAVVDKWNRSFMGFDYELLPEEDIIPENPIYAKFTDVPAYNNIQYAWDGTKVMVIGQAPAETDDQGQSNGDLTRKFTGVWNNGESVNYSNDVLTYTSIQWGGMNYWISNEGENWSTYEKVVFEFEEGTPVKTKVCVETTNIGSIEKETEAGATRIELDIKDKNANVKQVWLQAYDAATFKISKIYLVGEAPVTTPIEYYDPNGYLLGDDNKVMFYDSSNTNMYGGIIIELNENDMKTTQDGKTCLNLVKFKELADGGYHPISTDLKKWVKWQAACDGYYSDWIVTLTEAKRQTPPDTPPTNPDGIVCRIIVEDLTVGENSDFDFNDVVFDVCQNGTLIIRAIGGELPIYIGTEGANEVHEVCSITLPASTNQGKNSHMFMRNTGWKSTGNSKTYEGIDYDADLGHISLGRTFNSPAEAKTIGIWVEKNKTNIKLQAPKGKVASMVCVGTDYKWCAERQDIDAKYHKGGVKLFHQYVIGDPEYGDDWQHKNAWYHKLDQ